MAKQTQNEKDVQKIEQAEQEAAAAAGAPDDERPETGFKDVSDAQAQAIKDAAEPLELDDEGRPKNLISEAAIEVAQEQSYRASAQANGGGPWPPELVRERFVGSTPLRRSVYDGYTSHEVKHA